MQNERKLLLIINPISGTDNKEKIEPLVRKYLEPLGYKIRVDYTCAHGDATRLAHWAVDNGYFGVIAAGGDGTVNETAIALCDTDTALAIIPCGSGNGLARHLGIPIGITDSIKIISEGHILACDYGSVNRRPFFCTFGVGFDAAVSETFAKQRRRGKFSYLKIFLLEKWIVKKATSMSTASV